MLELNASLATAPDILSLIPALQAPAVSTNESTTPALNFSALLTELVGTVQESIAPAAPAAQETNAVPEPTPAVQMPGLVRPMIFVEEALEIPETLETAELPETEELPETSEPELKTENKEKRTETETEPTPELITTKPPEQMPLLVVPVEPQPQVRSQIPERKSIQEHEPIVPRTAFHAEKASVIPSQQPPVQAAAQSTAEEAWAEVRKFEYTVEREAPQRAAHQAQVQPAATSTEVTPKQAMITTNPLANLRQDTLPPRIVLVDKAGIETRLPDRSKTDFTGLGAEHTTAPATQFSDVFRSFEQVEQALPAQPIEIPDLPQLKVVRAVSMEVGDADSQVVIRIQERSGDLTMQLNAGSESLREELQSSVESLMNALKQEEVKVANVEVTRKASIDKVRRMKETK